MTYNKGDIVVVVDPNPFLDDRNYTDGLYFNNTEMSVFIGRKFIISSRRNKDTYILRYADKHDCLEAEGHKIEEWIWNEKWLMSASEFDFDELECCELFDVTYMVEG